MEPTFMGIPERWLDDPTWKCPNGHVSKWCILSEAKGGDICPACHEFVRLCDPDEVEVTPPNLDEGGEMVSLRAPDGMLALTLHDSLWRGLQAATGIHEQQLDYQDALLLRLWADNECDNPSGQRAGLARALALLLDVTGTMTVLVTRAGDFWEATAQ